MRPGQLVIIRSNLFSPCVGNTKFQAVQSIYQIMASSFGRNSKSDLEWKWRFSSLDVALLLTFILVDV